MNGRISELFLSESQLFLKTFFTYAKLRLATQTQHFFEETEKLTTIVSY